MSRGGGHQTLSTITSSITIGSAAYASPFTLAGTLAVIPSVRATAAITMNSNTSLDNLGFIDGGTYGGAGVSLSSGALVNDGMIVGGAGNAQGNSYTTNGGYGISMAAPFGGGGPATITNAGTVLGGAGGADVSAVRYSAAGGAVYLYGLGTTLDNTGLIRGGAGGVYQPGAAATGGGGGVGVKMNYHAVLYNRGTIEGGAGGAGTQAGSGGYGVFMQSYSTLTNTGLIMGGEPGAGSAASGGAAGVYLRNGVLINAGTIAAAATVNSSGIRYAVRFGVIDTATLAVEQGASFNGVVFANVIQADVLELAGTAGVTLTGVGSEYKYFTNISFANASRDVLEGSSYGLAHGALIMGFNTQDTVILDGFAATTETVANGANLTLGNGSSFETIAIAGPLATQDFTITTQGGNTSITSAVLCFCAGTKISTPAGARPVEHLRIGDLVDSVYGPPVPILWIGRRSYEGAFINENHLARPVHIAKGAIAPGIPSRALRVSPGHGIFIDGVLIPAWRLINGISITQPACSAPVHYIHIETQAHDVIVAENCPVESLLALDMRGLFQNEADYHGRYPEGWPEPVALPRVESGFQLAAIQLRLARRAGLAPKPAAPGRLRGYIDTACPPMLQGWAQDMAAPEAPVCLDIFLEEVRIARLLANLYRADLRKAGIGSGCHGFACALPEGFGGRLRVRRAADAAELADVHQKAAVF